MTQLEYGQLQAGAAKVDITPNDLTGLTNLWGRPFEGVHDPIFLRALVITNGHNTAAIVTADLVEFGDTLPVRERIANELDIPADHIFITASHDHNAPRAGVVTPGAIAKIGGSETVGYTEKVYDQIIEVIRLAKANLRPARVGIGKGTADININRDVLTPEGWKLGENPEGPSEKTVWVIKFESTEGDPFAILMNYAVHSVVIGPENTLVTGDLAGAAERYVEQHYQGKAIALWTMGPAGDQNPKYIRQFKKNANKDIQQSDYVLMDALGLILGEEVIHVSERIKKMTTEVRIRAEERVVSLPARIPPRDLIRNAHSKNNGIEIEKVDNLDLRLGLILLNHIAITTVSGEVNTKIYQRLKKESPFTNTLMATLANDRIGYIVDDAGYDNPTHGTMGTPIQRGYAENAIVNNLVEMINKV